MSFQENVTAPTEKSGVMDFQRKSERQDKKQSEESTWQAKCREVGSLGSDRPRLGRKQFGELLKDEGDIQATASSAVLLSEKWGRESHEI